MNEYTFHSVTSENQQAAYSIYQKNQAYFALTKETPSIEQLMRDMTVLPPSVVQEQKVFSIIYYDQKPIAVMDYLVDYPQEGTAYIGLLLVGERRKGHGQAIYQQVEQDWRLKEISLVSLAVIEENTAGRSFWESQGFKETRKAVTTVSDQEVSVVCFEKKIRNS